MREIFKQRIIEIEKNLFSLTNAMGKGHYSSLYRAKYRFLLDTYMLNIELLASFEKYIPRFK
jgi:hypothetical protein